MIGKDGVGVGVTVGVAVGVGVEVGVGVAVREPVRVGVGEWRGSRLGRMTDIRSAGADSSAVPVDADVPREEGAVGPDSSEQAVTRTAAKRSPAPKARSASETNEGRP
jgi:hypothetical protein